MAEKRPLPAGSALNLAAPLNPTPRLSGRCQRTGCRPTPDMAAAVLWCTVL